MELKAELTQNFEDKCIGPQSTSAWKHVYKYKRALIKCGRVHYPPANNTVYNWRASFLLARAPTAPLGLDGAAVGVLAW